MKQPNRILTSLPLVFAAACSSGGSSSSTTNAPSVEVTAPQQTLTLQSGEAVEIRWVDRDDDDQATTDVVAVNVDTAVEISIVAGAPELDGVEQSVQWTPSAQITGTYRIEARTTDGTTTATASANGRVLVGMQQLLEPGARAIFSGGRPQSLVLHDDVTFSLAGSFGSFEPLVVAEGEPNEVTETSVQSDVFLANFSPDGVFRSLARTHYAPITSGLQGGLQSGEQGGVGLLGIAAMGTDTVAALGLFGGRVTVGLGEPRERTFEADTSSFFNATLLLVRYGADGQVLWSSEPISGFQDTRHMQIAADGNGFWLLCAADEDTVFGVGQTNETALGVEALVLSRWSEAGTLVEARIVSLFDINGGIDDWRVASNPAGLSMAALFYDQITLNAGTPDEVTFQATTDREDDVLLLQNAPDGSFAWARTVGIDSDDGYLEPIEIVQLDDGSVRVLIEYSIGDTGAVVLFGAGEANETQVSLPAEADGSFLAAFASNGDYEWVVQLDEVDAEDTQLFRYGETGVGLLGQFGDELTIVDAQDNATTLFEDATPGLGELFLARFGADGSLTFALNDGGEDGDHSEGDVIAVPGPAGGQVLWAGSSDFSDEFQLGTNDVPVTLPQDRAFLAVFGPEGELSVNEGSSGF